MSQIELLQRYSAHVKANAVYKQSAQKPYEIAMLPLAMGGSKLTANRGYLSLSEWIEAHTLALNLLKEREVNTVAKRHARAVLKQAKSIEGTEELQGMCKEIVGNHGNAAFATLYNFDGREISGSYEQLEIETALPRNWISDLVGGRKRTLHGWCGSKKEAMAGKKKRGRPPKTDDPLSFFENPI